MVCQSYTAVVERNRVFKGEFATEPYECGWAGEAIFFFRKLQKKGPVAGTPVRVQISADGMHWCDEGTVFLLTNREVDFCKVSHFGNWLRIAGRLPPRASICALVTLMLKE